ncbi:histone deacetylase [Crocinitomicaceae bacterium]|nr:histone deacetylase [Crocinitomicaceae bacterium]MDC0257462.1 histone deacetylase [Crocinitomicaceae bacterium]
MLQVSYNDIYVHPLPENHRFPMEKYELLIQQLLYEGTISEEQVFSPESIHLQDVLKVHDSDYLKRLKRLEISPKEQRVSGFVHNQRLISRELMIMGGTRACAERVLNGGAAMNIAGGTHHAFTNRGEGFCLLNDQAIAAKWLLDATNVQNILIVDLDVHQGNGTAEIFRDTSEVFTFSMHGKNNYPLKKETSNLDVELEDAIGDTDYLYKLEASLDSILKEVTPDFVFYQCGVDVVATDKLGKLGMTRNGCKRRDEIVFETVKQLEVPVVCTMGGGYSPHIKDIVEAHANTYRVAQNILF